VGSRRDRFPPPPSPRRRARPPVPPRPSLKSCLHGADSGVAPVCTRRLRHHLPSHLLSCPLPTSHPLSECAHEHEHARMHADKARAVGGRRGPERREARPSTAPRVSSGGLLSPEATRVSSQPCARLRAPCACPLHSPPLSPTDPIHSIHRLRHLDVPRPRLSPSIDPVIRAAESFPPHPHDAEDSTQKTVACPGHCSDDATTRAHRRPGCAIPRHLIRDWPGAGRRGGIVRRQCAQRMALTGDAGTHMRTPAAAAAAGAGGVLPADRDLRPALSQESRAPAPPPARRRPGA
jgi:hypothetical protein